MYAIIATGGKQYKVSEGDVLKVEKLNAAEGDTVTFDQVIAVSDNPVIIRKMVTDSLTHRLRLKRSTLNQKV